MLNLLKSTEFNKRIPKKKFYEQLEVTPEIKRIFVDQIKNIIWRNKIAASTVNIAAGHDVTEIEVIEVQLNQKELDTKALKLIDQGIPYHIVFVLHMENVIQIWTAYKQEKTPGAFKVDRYFHTDWMNEGEWALELNGLNLDQVYESIVRKIAGDELNTDPEETLQESVKKAKKINELEAKITKLQTKMRKEKQFNKKVKINDEIKGLKAELSKIRNE